MGKYVDYYCINENRRLKPIVDNILKRYFGWLPQSDYDDFYSIAGQTVWDCELRYDIKKNNSFENYLKNSLLRKLKSRITYCNRQKRKQKDINGNPINEISVNALIDGDLGIKIEETLIGDIDVFESALDIDDYMSDEMQEYIKSLTKQQREIALLIAKGYTPTEIQNILKINNLKYQEQWSKMTSLRKISVLCKERNNGYGTNNGKKQRY